MMLLAICGDVVVEVAIVVDVVDWLNDWLALLLLVCVCVVDVNVIYDVVVGLLMWLV